MIKFMFGLLVLAQFSWALPQSMMACNSKLAFKSQIKFADKAMSLQLEGVDQAGKPFVAQTDYQVLATHDFRPTDFATDSLAAINNLAGITSFSAGTAVSIGNATEAPSTLYFFEFEPGQHSVLWIIEGMAVLLGKTTECK